MKGVKLIAGLIFLVAVTGVLTITALNQVEIDRNVSATVYSDTAADVAVQFELLNHGLEGPDYTALGSVVDGRLTINLDEILGANSGFNPSAKFVIGTTTHGVLRITNNTPVSIVVSLTADPAGSIKLFGSDGIEAGSSVIATTASETYFFEINTPQTTVDLTAVLAVRKNS